MFKKPLIYIVSLAFILRLVGLSSFPVGLNPDEASQGYSAYSLLRTGMDEWGNKLPITSIKSFLDYKAPLYTYLTIPSVGIFDLNRFSVRLPSAISGTLAVIFIYFLANLLYPGTGNLASFLLAISPWSISFSRSAMEANLLPPIIFAAFYFLLKSRSNPKYFILSTLFFSLSFYAYHAAKIFVPIFLIIYLLKYRKDYAPKTLLFSLFTFLLLASPIIGAMLFDQGAKRGGDLLLTGLSGQQLKSIQDIQYFSDPGSVTRIFYNKLTYFWHLFLENYLSYFSPVFWLSSGSGNTSYSNLPNFGLIYFWTLPFLLLGLKEIIQKSKSKFFFLLWLFAGPIPAAITKDPYHAHRAVVLLGLFEIFTAIGLVKFIKKSKVYLYLFLLTCLLSLSSYLFRYSFVYPVKHLNGMSNLYNQAIVEVIKLESGYQNVYLPERLELQSLVAFYQKTDPKVFQEASRLWQKDLLNRPDILYLDQLPNIILGKFLFKSFNWPDDIKENSLYLVPVDKLPQKRHTLKVIYTQDQSPFLEIIDFKNEEK